MRRTSRCRASPSRPFPVDDTLLFRRASAFCLEPVSFAIEGGRNARGGTGWRQIAQCRTGAEGPGFAVQLGFGKDPHAKPNWKGGPVRGYISTRPIMRRSSRRRSARADPRR